MKKLVIKDQKKFNRFILLSLVVLTIVIYSLFSILSPSQVKGESESYYFTVLKGDTIWSIAELIEGPKDIREKVFDIYQLNNLSPNENIYPGQVILLPVYE